jgi:hypothetical protein
LLFNHGGALRLDVECLECELTDLGTDDLGTSGAGAAGGNCRPILHRSPRVCRDDGKG